MELSSLIQESLVCLLCFDRQASSQLVSFVEVGWLDPFYKQIGQAAIDYHHKYRKPPGEHTLDIIESLIARDEESSSIYRRIYRSMLSVKDELNREYVLSKIQPFARYQRCMSSMTKALDLLKKSKADPDVDGAESVLAAVSTPLEGVGSFDAGITLNDPAQVLNVLSVSDAEIFLTGIKEIDKAYASPFRGGNHLFMAPSGRGKSMWAVNCGKFGLLSRAKVLHITLELSARKTALRYLQSLFARTKREAEEVTLQYFSKDKDGSFLRMARPRREKRPGLLDSGSNIQKKIKEILRHKPRLLIKQFPTGQLTTDKLRSYLDNLERVEKFSPDMMIVDYPDLMKLDPKNERVELARIHVELRGIAVERNLALINITQANRPAYGVRLLRESHVAGSIEKFNCADTVVTYNQTPAELSRGLARLHVLKIRDEEGNLVSLISQAYKIGQFCLDSVRMDSKRYWESIGEEQADEA